MSTVADSAAAKLSPKELDQMAARLDAIELEEESIRTKLMEQIEAHDFTPPRAEKSKRLLGNLY